ncbi:MAG TPA: AzlD domain-containing protein [Chloroflexota bacterium]
MTSEAFITIVGMAIVTYSTRAGGMWLMRLTSPSARVERWLQHIPGSVLAAIIAPAVIAHGVSGVVAVLVTGAVSLRTGNLLLAMASGVITVYLVGLLVK